MSKLHIEPVLFVVVNGTTATAPGTIQPAICPHPTIPPKFILRHLPRLKYCEKTVQLHKNQSGCSCFK